MKNKIIIIKIYFFFFFTITAYCQSSQDFFVIDGVIQGDYKGYLYLNYNNKRDSCLIEKNRFHFEGRTSNENIYMAFFSTKRVAAMDKNFYLENKNISMEIDIINRKIRETELDWIVINKITGTKTSLIEKDFEDFINKYQNDKDWLVKKYLKLDEIISENPRNQYSGELLQSVSLDSLVDLKQLEIIYNKLDLASQIPSTIINLKQKIYPAKSLKIGKQMLDFELPNEKGKLINTIDYRGSILFVDFWASWCAPCRKQIPEIKLIHEKFKHKKFKILSVSIDKEKEKWILALKKEKMVWENVLDIREFNSPITLEYEINSIPNTFLIDENGVIIANNPSIEEIINYLNLKK